MNRREAVQYISLLVGGTVIGSSAFLAGCTNNPSGTSMTFSDADISLLDEVADTILPPTKTPGAKAAKVGQFMTVMVNDCYDTPDQKIFLKNRCTKWQCRETLTVKIPGQIKGVPILITIIQ